MLREPVGEEVAEGLELKVDVLAVPEDGLRAADGAGRVDEVGRRVGGAAVVAGVAVLSGRAALRAGALDEAVGQEHRVMLAVHLRHHLRGEDLRLDHLLVDAEAEGLVLRAVGRVVVVEADAEAGEVCAVLGVAPRDEFLGGDALLAGADHDWRAMGVVGADVDAVVAAHLLEAHPEIRLEIFHQMADVDCAVRVRQR